MKFVFTSFLRCLPAGMSICILSAIFAASVVMGQSLSYNNSSTITFPPNINAYNFTNSGLWEIVSTPTPYRTLNTLNYYNSGEMACDVGWDFSFHSSGGASGWSTSFYNNTFNPQTGNGSIIATSPGSTTIFTGGNGASFQVSPLDYLLVSATNLVNKGLLSADVYGLLQLNGSDVNLSRSELVIVPVADIGSATGNGNFTPSPAVYDSFWGLGVSKAKQDTAALWNGVSADSMFGISGTNVECLSGTGYADGLRGVDLAKVNIADSLIVTNLGLAKISTTNADGSTQITIISTNMFLQAAFAQKRDPAILGAVTFSRAPNEDPTNGFDTAEIVFAAPYTNFETLAVTYNPLYVSDSLASIGKDSLDVNNYVNPYAACSVSSFRPDNYIVSRSDPSGGSSGNGFPATNFFTAGPDGEVITNTVVTVNQFTTYGADIDNQGIQINNGGSISNLPGRVLINANNLNLNNTRIRGEGSVVINASNLVNSAGAVVDCENISYNLGSTNGLINMTNLALPTVSRFTGTVSAWSATWQNTAIVILTNNFTVSWNTNVTPPVVTNAVLTPLTNFINLNYHVLLVDGTGLTNTVPVTVRNLTLNSTNMIISDPMNIQNSLLFNGISLTLNGALSLGGGITNWSKLNAPNLLYFTNNNVLSIPNNAIFGDDRAVPYSAFVNNSNIVTGLSYNFGEGETFFAGGSETINTLYYQNSGSDVVGGFYLTAVAGLIQNGVITSTGDVDFNGNVLKLFNARITTDGALNLNVTGTLYDAGGSSSNQLECSDGFNLIVKPTGGDLLGTTITSDSISGAEVDSTWAGVDRGASSAGFLNNAALGKLVLSTQGAQLYPPLFVFSPVGVSNAIYVDNLDLSQLGTDYADVLKLNPGMVIYYASAELSFTPPPLNGIPQEPEEYLNGQFNNQLRWVSSFAGPNSSVYVLINGQSVLVNRALRNSKIIDSNGNGIPNFFDVNPFDAAPFVIAGSLVQTNQPSSSPFAISWLALPNSIYQVQFTTNLVSSNWQPLLSYTNNGSTSQHVTIWDTNKLSNQRFYRESVLLQIQ